MLIYLHRAFGLRLNMKYSIWLIPSSPTFENIQNCIRTLSEKHNGPIFEPHITILGNIEKDLGSITTTLEKLANNVHVFKLQLGEISISNTYFQSVLIRVRATDTLMRLHQDMKSLLNVESSPFMPHMSLLYGNHDMEVREKIASSIKLPPETFHVNEFIITPATSNPSEWDHLATIPFGN